MKHNDDDNISFFLSLNIFGVQDAAFACDVTTERHDHPRVAHYGVDNFGLPPDLREKLALELYRFLRRYLLDSICGTVTAVDWSQPDLRPWLKHAFYRGDERCLARLLEAKVDPAVEVPFVRPIISTRHD
jgi:hypothetical protein